MSPQCHAQQLLDALYRRLLGRGVMGARRNGDDWVEPLPPRMLLSVTPAGGEVLINTTVANAQQTADVVVTVSGGAVAVWSSANQDGNGWGVFGQRFDSSGNAAGSEFQVNQSVAGDQIHPRIAVDASGNFIVTWTSSVSGNLDIFARQYDAAGAPQAGEFQVNSVTTGTQQNPDVAMESGGNFIVVWEG